MKAVQRIAILVLAAGAGTFVTAAQAEVHFKQISFAEAKKLAAKEKKKIMVDFYTDWCGWCKVLDKKTYSDDAVGKIADAKFISVKIDAEKGEGIELAKKSQVTGYPTIVFFSADGQEVDRVVGYQDASRFSRSLSLAAAGGTKAVIAEVTGKTASKDASKWLIAANYYAEHQQVQEAQTAYNRVLDLDVKNDQHLKEEALYGLAFVTEGPQQWEKLSQAVAEYPMREEGRQAVMMLSKHYLETNDPDNAVRMIDTWAMRHPDDMNTFNFFAWTAAEQGIVLDKALELADRAIALSTEKADRASAMDTYAEILFKQGRASDAVRKEEEAIALLDPQKDKKLMKDLTAQRAKFAASSTAPASTEAAH